MHPESHEAVTRHDRMLDRADHYLLNSDYARAESTLREALALWPESVGALIMLSETLLLMDRVDEADTLARDAAGAAPSFPRAIIQVGRVRMAMGENREAEANFLEALRIDPQDTFALTNYARLLYRVGQEAKAEKVLLRSLEIDPEDSESLALLGVIQSSRGDRDAKVHGDRAIAIDPDRDFSHASAGVVALRSGRPFRARYHLREALRLDPSDSDIEDAFHEVDTICRWTYIPNYFIELLVDRLPGKHFALWGIFVAVFFFGRSVDPGGTWVTPVAFGWIGFCLYSWVAAPITRAWIRLRPPRY